MTNTTQTRTFDQMTESDEWLGFGYLGERSHAIENGQTDEVAAADAFLLALNLTDKQLFTWANSKDGRWFGDAVFGGSGSLDERFAQAQRWGVVPSKRR